MKEITLSDENMGQRIDKYLTSEMEDVSRGEVIRMIKSGAITVNGKNTKPSYSLKGSDVIEIGEYVDRSQEITPNKNIFIDIIENNDDFLIVNKHLGLQVHPSHREREKTLVNALLARFPEIKGVGEDEERPGIVHRIDKDTTGLLIVAKNQKTFTALKKCFSKREVKKTYHAIVFGHFDEKTGEIDAPIARATSYKKQKIAFGKYKGDSRESQTLYEVIEQYKINDLPLSLVEITPKTGRTHQIRVHMAHIGHPLLGDERYYTKNERKITLPIPKEYDIDTFFLHAKDISFEINGKNHHFSVKYPDRFNAIVRYLRGFEV